MSGIGAYCDILPLNINTNITYCNAIKLRGRAIVKYAMIHLKALLMDRPISNCKGFQ
jgi:hypothetical protein